MGARLNTPPIDALGSNLFHDEAAAPGVVDAEDVAVLEERVREGPAVAGGNLLHVTDARYLDGHGTAAEDATSGALPFLRRTNARARPGDSRRASQATAHGRRWHSSWTSPTAPSKGE
jgi:hypothetical protein